MGDVLQRTPAAADPAPHTRYDEMIPSPSWSYRGREKVSAPIEAVVLRVLGGSSILLLCTSALLAASTTAEAVVTGVGVLALMAMHYRRIRFHVQHRTSWPKQHIDLSSKAWLAALVVALPVLEPVLVHRHKMPPVLYCINQRHVRDHIRARFAPHPRVSGSLGSVRGDHVSRGNDAGPVNPPRAVWEMIRPHYADNQLAERVQGLTLLSDTSHEIIAWFIVAIAAVGYFGARCVAGGDVFHHVSFWCGVVFLNCLAFASSWKPDPVLGFARFLSCASDGSSIFALIGATYALAWAGIPLPSAVATCAWWCVYGIAGNLLFAFSVAVRFDLLAPRSMPLPQTLRVVGAAVVSAVIMSFDRLNMMWMLDNCVNTRLGMLQIARLAETAIRHAPADLRTSVAVATHKFFEDEIGTKSNSVNLWRTNWLLLLNGSIHGKTYPSVCLVFYVLCQMPALLFPSVIIVTLMAQDGGGGCPAVLLRLSVISVALMAAIFIVAGRRIWTLLSLPVIPVGTTCSASGEFERCERYIALLSRVALPPMGKALVHGASISSAVLPADVVEHAVAPYVAPEAVEELSPATCSALRRQIREEG